MRPGEIAPRRTILVTGFGGFPGSPRNPTESIIAKLRRHRGRLARLGVDVQTVVLPVRYDALQDSLGALAELYRPDVVLHFGVAGGRRHMSVELQAINRANPLHPDASGRRPVQVLQPGGRPLLRATYPASRVLSALRREGFRAEPSRSAGDYVCNATLYRSLAMRIAPEVGFIHVPRTRRPATRRDRQPDPPRPPLADLTRAALTVVLALARRPATGAVPSRDGHRDRQTVDATDMTASTNVDRSCEVMVKAGVR